MTRVILSGGRIIDPAAAHDAPGDLVIEGGRIAFVGPPAEPRPGDETVDCAGRLVLPGFVDLHVHLREPPLPGGERDPSLPETIATGAAAAVAGGFTTVCAMPNTDPPIDDPDHIRHYLARGREVGLARVMPVGTMTRGRRGREVADLAAMLAAGAVAFSDDGSDVADGAVFEAVLREVARLGAVAICHAEDANLAAGGVVNDGPLATALGLPGIPAEAEIRAVRRACRAAARAGCRLHVAHVSTAGAVAAVREAKAAGAAVTAEATPHHLALTDDALRSRGACFRVNPPLRSAGDMAAVLEGVRDGTIDCLATDHAPHSVAAKARGLADAPPGMIGLESALPVYVRTLVDTGILAWPDLVARMTLGPARALALDAGTLAEGAPPDVTVVDPEAEWTIDPEAFASRARNCPFARWRARGKVVLTFVGGRAAYRA